MARNRIFPATLRGARLSLCEYFLPENVRDPGALKEPEPDVRGLFRLLPWNGAWNGSLIF